MHHSLAKVAKKTIKMLGMNQPAMKEEVEMAEQIVDTLVAEIDKTKPTAVTPEVVK